MVAKLIAVRGMLGHKRTIFYVSHGGYDHHDGLADAHLAMLQELNGALTSFYQATVELGVANQVTLFTASDFGRGLQVNGRGSDHSWGAHHFVLSGSVISVATAFARRAASRRACKGLCGHIRTLARQKSDLVSKIFTRTRAGESPAQRDGIHAPYSGSDAYA